MPAQLLSALRRHPSTIACALACATLAACGGGDPEAPASEGPTATVQARRPATTTTTTTGNVLEVGSTISGFPHKIDTYRPVGATRAVVYLHGNGGTSGSLAYTLGFSKTAVPSDKTVVWDWLTTKGVIAVLPQGQAAPGSTTPTWSNYLNNSGQDDVAFLKALVANVKARYGVSEVALAGYSAGGVMTGRMWCEAAGSYKSFVSIAGPMMSGTGTGVTCAPAVTAPYFAMLGAKDTVVPSNNPGLPKPSPEQMAAGLTAGFLVAEWTRDGDRSRTVCGESVSLSNGITSSAASNWVNCSGRTRFMAVKNADHTLTSFQTATGTRVVDIIDGFVK